MVLHIWVWEISTTPEILFMISDCYRSQGFFYFAVPKEHLAPCCNARSVEYSRTLPSLRVLQNANCIHNNSQYSVQWAGRSALSANRRWRLACRDLVQWSRMVMHTREKFYYWLCLLKNSFQACSSISECLLQLSLSQFLLGKWVYFLWNSIINFFIGSVPNTGR